MKSFLRNLLPLILSLVCFAARVTKASEYVTTKVSDFKFQKSPGGNLDFKNPWEVGGQLFFDSTSSNGSQFYRTDGNVVTEFDLNPGGSSAPTWFYLWRNTLFFDAFSNAQGWELYSTAGDAPTLVADIVPGSGSSSAGGGAGYAELGDHLYFFTSQPDGNGLYRTSGAGVEYVAPASNNTLPIFNTINGQLIYVGNGSTGEEFYRTDGHSISLLADVNPGPAGSKPQSLFEYAGNLYFNATGPHGTELFKTDGKSVTELDINPGQESSNPTNPIIFKNQLYFSAIRNNGYELFKTDGADVTEFDINPGPANSLAFVGYRAILGDRLYFAATGTHGAELFNTDGTNIKEFDINPGPADSNPLAFRPTSNALYFSARGPQGVELYEAQGDNITLIDLNPGPASSNPNTSSLIEYKGSAYLSANGPMGTELYRISGTDVTEFDILPGPQSSSPKSFIEFNGDLFFTAIGPNGRAIYRTDGTAIEELINLEPHIPPSFGLDPRFTDFVYFDDSLFFIGETSEGAHLYRISIVPESLSMWPLLLLFFSTRHRFNLLKCVRLI